MRRRKPWPPMSRDSGSAPAPWRSLCVYRARARACSRGTLTNSSSTSGGDTHTSSAESAENSTQAAWAARLAEASTQKLPRLWQGAPRALLVWPAPLGLVGWWLWRAFSA